MRMESGRRLAGLILLLAAGASLYFGAANPARSEWEKDDPPPARAAPAAPAEPFVGPPIPEELTKPSQVFPDGGFPSKPAPEGAIPTTTPQTGIGNLYAAPPSLPLDYSRVSAAVRPY